MKVLLISSLLMKYVMTNCDPEMAALYNMTLTTHWTTENYPKQYPTWRPPAQWSPVFGFSHAKDHPLYHVGSVADDGVASFVETGSTETLLHNLDMETVLDIITAPAVKSGEGTTQTSVFVDGNHSKISLMSKLVPSPDWFIGVDSLNLCEDNTWVDSISEHLQPHDGGSDNGFTFTSPNWPTQPRGVVFQISSRYPTHPAGSFHYPHLDKLPSIATIHFKKVREYKELKKRREKAINPESYKYFHEGLEDNNEIAMEFVPMKSGKKKTILSLMRSKETTVKKKNRKKKNLAAFRSPGLELSASEDKLNDFLSSKHSSKSLKRRKRKLRGKQRHKKKKSSTDCVVSPWGEWTSCSVSCGIGEKIRQRTIKKNKKGQGQVCPQLQEMSWCGSARDCHPGYFDW